MNDYQHSTSTSQNLVFLTWSHVHINVLLELTAALRLGERSLRVLQLIHNPYLAFKTIH